MSREQKAEIIDSLQEAFTKCNIAILTDYRGLATPKMTTLRRQLQESGSEYRVVKNTLARLAAERAGKEKLASALNGPMAIAFGYKDIAAPARVLTSYTGDATVSFSIKGGFLNERLLTAEEVITLSTLPPKEVLLARVLGQMKSPVAALLGGLTAPMRGMIGVLQARIKQLEGE
ncbi:MAG: 50S ribosomal protein L10 [Chloroflexi bacterium]|nr:50S ribosomal protein L10 [Chloroflexota bacterium]